jgi:hypothetical protein
MDELKLQAQRIHNTIESLGFHTTTYDTLPMMLAFLLADIRESMQAPDYARVHHLGLASLRSLEVLYGAFRFDWDCGRTAGRKPPSRPQPLYAVDTQLLVVAASVSSALQHYARLEPKDVMISLELTLLNLHRATDVMQLDFQGIAGKALDSLVALGPRSDGDTRWF